MEMGDGRHVRIEGAKVRGGARLETGWMPLRGTLSAGADYEPAVVLVVALWRIRGLFPPPP